MQFVAYLTYNNNGDAMYGLRWEGHNIRPGFSTEHGITFDNTDDGLVIFRHRFASFENKIGYYTHLQENLKAAFGHGFSVAVAPASDCSNDWEMAQFCKEMKKLDPAITTIMYASPTAVMPKDVRDAYYGSDDESAFDFYKKTPVISARDAFAVSASGTALQNGIDHFVNYWVLGDTQGSFIRLLRENAKATPFDMTGDLKEKIGEAVALAYAASEGKAQAFKPEKYVP